MITTPLIELLGVTRRFRQGDAQVLGVSGVDLTLHGGEFVVVAGPSGSGKSSLLHLMAGLDDPDEGTVRFAGTDLRALGDAARAELRRRSIGFVFQAFNLVPVLSAYENVEYGLWLNGVSGAARRKRALEMLDAVGLSHRGSHRPDHLSGGERQRMHLARAFLQLAKAAEARADRLLLLDEPTASLDLAHQLQVLQEVRKESGDGCAVLVVLHDLNLAARYADEIMVMGNGRVAGHGTPREIFDDGLLSGVFGCVIEANRSPGGGEPFVLPQMCRARE